MGQAQSECKGLSPRECVLQRKQRKIKKEEEEDRKASDAPEFADLHVPECPCCKAAHWQAPHRTSEPIRAAREAIMDAVAHKNGDKVVRIFETFRSGPLLQLKISIDVHACATVVGHALTRGLFGACVDMVVLVFDVLNEEQRERLLKHFKTYRAHGNVVHVLSDVDDTLFASKMGGSDKAYPNHHWYPGVMELLCQLSNSYVTLLTARPQGALERSLVKKMLKFGVRAHTLADTLGGIVMEGVPSVVRVARSTDTIAHYDRFRANKLDAAEKMGAVFPEYRFIFFGDVGQGDLAAGMQMLQSTKLSRQMLGVFIHDITRDATHFQGLSRKRIPEIAAWFPELLPTLANPRLTVFTHYPDAVLRAWEMGCLTTTQALKVIAAAQTTATAMKHRLTADTATLQIEMIAGLLGSLRSASSHIVTAASTSK